MPLLCILHIDTILVIHNEEPEMLQAMAENKYPDRLDIHRFRCVQFQPVPMQHLHPLPPPLSLAYPEEQRITMGTRRQCAVAPGAPLTSAVCGYTRTFIAVAVLSAARPRLPATAAPMALFTEPEEG